MVRNKTATPTVVCVLVYIIRSKHFFQFVCKYIRRIDKLLWCVVFAVVIRSLRLDKYVYVEDDFDVWAVVHR